MIKNQWVHSNYYWVIVVSGWKMEKEEGWLFDIHALKGRGSFHCALRVSLFHIMGSSWILQIHAECTTVLLWHLRVMAMLVTSPMLIISVTLVSHLLHLKEQQWWLQLVNERIIFYMYRERWAVILVMVAMDTYTRWWDFQTEAANGAIISGTGLRVIVKYCSFLSIMHDVKIAVIGGSGLYHLDNLEIVEEVHPETVNVNGGGLQRGKGSTHTRLIALGFP